MLFRGRAPALAEGGGREIVTAKSTRQRLSYFIIVGVFCWVGRSSPRNRRDGVLSYFNMSHFNIIVTFYLILSLSELFLPPACAAVFGAGRRRSRWGEGEGAQLRDGRRSVPPYFIVVVLFICLFF